MPPNSPQDMMAAVTESMQVRTGRTLQEWVGIVRSSGLDPLDQNAVRRWLKSEHGVLQNSRYAIADAAARRSGWTEPSVEEYIDQQYAGKAALRPIFDRLREIIEALGDDVSTEGRATYTPFVRRRQFAAIAAATKNRIDVGLRFTKPPRTKRLVEATAPGQATHRISLSSMDELDDDVRKLLHVAYEQNG